MPSGGVIWVRMRFAPILQEFTTRHAAVPGFGFLHHSWLYCSREFGYQATPDVTLAPYFLRKEPTKERPGAGF
jgi:hypothetical protein